MYFVFPNSIHSVVPEGSLQAGGEPLEHGISTSVTHGAMSGACHFSLHFHVNKMKFRGICFGMFQVMATIIQVFNLSELLDDSNLLYTDESM